MFGENKSTPYQEFNLAPLVDIVAGRSAKRLVHACEGKILPAIRASEAWWSPVFLPSLWIPPDFPFHLLSVSLATAKTYESKHGILIPPNL